MAIVSMSKDELKEYARGNLAFCRLDLNRISSILIAQIYRFEHLGVFSAYEILDEIKHLEGLKKSTLTGEARPFKGPFLSGLHKKHFSGARHILKNIGIYLGYESGRTARLDEIIREAFARNTSGYVDEDFIDFIAHETTVSAYEERVKKSLTGEWIVFRQHKNRNYYLTLAAHNEGDENILQRVKMAYEFDFPFLLDGA